MGKCSRNAQDTATAAGEGRLILAGTPLSSPSRRAGSDKLARIAALLRSSSSKDAPVWPSTSSACDWMRRKASRSTSSRVAAASSEIPSPPSRPYRRIRTSLARLDNRSNSKASTPSPPVPCVRCATLSSLSVLLSTGGDSRFFWSRAPHPRNGAARPTCVAVIADPWILFAGSVPASYPSCLLFPARSILQAFQSQNVAGSPQWLHRLTHSRRRQSAASPPVPRESVRGLDSPNS